jgi:hypothetical protein
MQRDSAPFFAVRNSVGSPVMEAREEFESIHGKFIGWNAEFVKQLADGGMLHSLDAAICQIVRPIHLSWDHSMQRMTATRIRPNLYRKRETETAIIRQSF